MVDLPTGTSRLGGRQMRDLPPRVDLLLCIHALFLAYGRARDAVGCAACVCTGPTVPSSAPARFGHT